MALFHIGSDKRQGMHGRRKDVQPLNASVDLQIKSTSLPHMASLRSEMQVLSIEMIPTRVILYRFLGARWITSLRPLCLGDAICRASRLRRGTMVNSPSRRAITRGH